MNPREPAFSGRSGCLSTNPRGFPLQKKKKQTKLSLLPQLLDLHLPKSPLPPFKQAVHTGTPDQGGPATLVDSHNVSSALLVDKGIDYQILQRIYENSKTISPSTLKIKYTSADACPEIVDLGVPRQVVHCQSLLRQPVHPKFFSR